jgi:hypothetical protein
MSPHEMQRAGNRVGVDDGMRSIVVRKRASNEDWLAPKPIPNDLARVEAFALELLPDRLKGDTHSRSIDLELGERPHPVKGLISEPVTNRDNGRF